jgi:hydrogenase nickel incorporation protein HypA/HybF
MHELALTRSMLELVSEAAQGRRVRRVTLEIGELAGVVAGAIEFCFPEVARDTVAAGAELEIRHITGRARCAECGGEFATPSLITPCRCGSMNFVRLQGEELTLKSLEVEAL